jgi:hypothetical protein
MSTAMHETHPSIRVGRFVSVSKKSSKFGPARGAEPLAPRFDEIRLLVFFGLSAMASLFGLALVGFLLLPETGSENNVAAASPPALVFAEAAPAIQPIAMILAHEPMADPKIPEVLPEPRPLLANLGAPFGKSNRPFVALGSDRRETGLPGLQEKSHSGSQCERFGTKIVFIKDPTEAFRKARDENKQVFFVHLSGNFEDNEFT